MTLEERMRRNDAEDQIEIGLIGERLTSGQTGQLLKALIEQIKEEDQARADNDPRLSADRLMGGLIALSKLQERLDQCVDIKNQLLVEKKEEKKVGGVEVAP